MLWSRVFQLDRVLEHANMDEFWFALELWKAYFTAVPPGGPLLPPGKDIEHAQFALGKLQELKDAAHKAGIDHAILLSARTYYFEQQREKQRNEASTSDHLRPGRDANQLQSPDAPDREQP